MTRIRSYIVVIFMTVAAMSLQRLYAQEETEGRFALVIGNSNYQDAPLLTPEADCQLIKGALEEVGFEVSTHFDLAQSSDFVEVLREFEDKTDSADIVLIYYAGHGIAVNGRNYLLPTNQQFRSERDVEDYGVSTEKILRAFESNENRANILVLDACRNNPFESNWRRQRGGQGEGLAKEIAPFGSIVAYSTSYGSTAADGDERNSPFAQSLAKNLVFPNISIERVFAKTREDVVLATDRAQRPIEENQLIGSEIVLNEKLFLKDVDLENMEAVLDTASGQNRSLIYSSLFARYQRDSTNWQVLIQTFYDRELSNTSKYHFMTRWFSSGSWAWMRSDSITAWFPLDEFMPIIENWDVFNSEYTSGFMQAQSWQHSALIGALWAKKPNWAGEPEPEALNALYEAMSGNPEELWRNLSDRRYWGIETKYEDDSISINEVVFQTMPALYEALCPWKLPSGVIEGYTREYWRADSTDRIDESTELRHDNFQAAAFRKADYRELRFTSWSNVMCWFSDWYGWEEDIPLWSYLGLFKLSKDGGYRNTIHMMQERYLIAQSGAINDKGTWLEAMPSLLPSWRRLLQILTELESDSASFFLPTDEWFYLNQDLQRAVYFESDHYSTLDSLAQEYMARYDGFVSKETIDLDRWDLAYSFSRHSGFYYHPENSEAYWDFYYPSSRVTSKAHKKAYINSLLLEKELFNEVYSLGRGISDDSLRFSRTLLPYNIESNHSSGALTEYLELSNWKRFLAQNLMPDTMRHDLIQRYNSIERTRRTSMFLRDVIIPWYSRFKNDPAETPEEYATGNAIAVHWDLLESVLQSGVNDPYFIELYGQILMTIQEKTELCIGPEYFGNILDWYVKNHANLSSEERLRAYATILQMEASLQPSSLEEYDNATADLLEKSEGNLEVIKTVQLLFNDDFGE